MRLRYRAADNRSSATDWMPARGCELGDSAAMTTPLPGAGYFKAAKITLILGGVLIVLFIIAMVVLAYYVGAWAIFIGIVGVAALFGLLLAVGMVAVAFFALGRSQQRGPVKGQGFTVAVTALGLPVTWVVTGLLSSFDLSTEMEAVIGLLAFLMIPLVVFCAIWSLWGPRRPLPAAVT